ncbi:hypothetical protein GCM10020258_07300 [Sphingomonas yabuuchiae]
MTTLGFTGGRLDRADPLRHDPAGFAAALADPAARLLVLDDYQPVMDGGRLGWTAIDVDATPRTMCCSASRTVCRISPG